MTLSRRDAVATQFVTLLKVVKRALFRDHGLNTKSLPASNSWRIASCGCSSVNEYLIWLTTTVSPFRAFPTVS